MDDTKKKQLADTLSALLPKIRTDARIVKARGKSPYKQDKAITEDDLRHHVNGGPAIVAYLVRPGTSSTDALAFDGDDHTGVMEWDGKVDVGIAIVGKLAERGIRAYLVRSGGGKGWHVWAFFKTPQDARSVRFLAREILAELGYTDGTGGLTNKQVEVYPKQDSVALGAYGGGIALPFSYESVLIDELTGEPLPKEDAIGLVWYENDVSISPAPAEPERVVGPVEDVDLAVLASALDTIPNDESVGYDDWLRTIAAVHGSAPDEEGRALAYAWSSKSSKHTDGEFNKRWDNFFDPAAMSKRATAGTIFFKARACGWVDPIRAALISELDAIDVSAALAEIPEPATAIAPAGPGPSDLPFLSRDTKGNAKPTLANAEAVLLNDYTSGGIRLAYDQFRDEILIAERPTQWRPIKDVDAVNLRIRFETMQDPIVGIGRETMRDAISAVADRHQFDSAIVWLRSLKWDGVSRIDNFFHVYFGTECSEYSRACSWYFWTGHAGRVLVPGIQADMAVILTGAQGRRKSSGLRALCPSPEFFVEINLALNPTDLARLLRGKLVAELAELSGLRSREIEHTKAFLARTHEDWVPKFKEHSFKYARRNLFTGTTNEDEFLDDTTGARRFLPLRVDGFVDVEAIVRDREQLWAEAAAVFSDGWALGEHGVQWEKAERLARDVHAEFAVTDPWDEFFHRWLKERETPDAPFTAVEALQGSVALSANQINHAHKKRAAAILKRFGFVDGRPYIDGRQVRAWIRKGGTWY